MSKKLNEQFEKKFKGKMDEGFSESVQKKDGLMEYWLGCGANINIVDRDGFTALMRSTCDGDIVAVARLIELGADVNVKTYNRTALIWACILGNYDIAEKLLQNGADPNLEHNDFSPLRAACGRNYIDIVELLLNYQVDRYKDNCDKESLFVRAGFYTKEIVEHLLDKGFNINSRNKNGQTALMKAIEWKNIRVVKYLIERGADVNIEDNDGYTALNYAYRDFDEKQLDFLDMLEEAGAKRGEKINHKKRDF